MHVNAFVRQRSNPKLNRQPKTMKTMRSDHGDSMNERHGFVRLGSLRLDNRPLEDHDDALSAAGTSRHSLQLGRGGRRNPTSATGRIAFRQARGNGAWQVLYEKDLKD